MNLSKSNNHCIYRVVTASTVDEVVKKVNEIIEQGWQSEHLVNGGWQFLGGITPDGKNYHQTLIKCPDTIRESD